jgi:hypothetical protein
MSEVPLIIAVAMLGLVGIVACLAPWLAWYAGRRQSAPPPPVQQIHIHHDVAHLPNVPPTGPTSGLSDRGRAALEAHQRQEWEAANRAQPKWGPYG